MLAIASIITTLVVFAVLLIYILVNKLSGALWLVVVLLVAYVFAVAGISVIIFLKKNSHTDTTQKNKDQCQYQIGSNQGERAAQSKGTYL